MDITSFTRKLYGGRNLTLTSYMRAPTVGVGGKSLIISCSPILLLKYEMKVQYGDPKPTDNTFKINPRNASDVIQLFSVMTRWMDPGYYSNLFIYDEHAGRLMVNMDYKDEKFLVKGGRYDAQAMLAIPAVVDQDGEVSGGAALSINRTNYTAMLRETDIRALHGILSSFSFQTEADLLVRLGMTPQFWDSQENLQEAKIIPSSATNSYTRETGKLIW